MVAAVHYFATEDDQEALLDYLGEPTSVLTAASDDDEGVTFGDDVKSRRGWTVGRAGGRHGVAAVVMLSRSLGHGCAASVRWSAAAQRREKLPAGDHRDDLPWRCDRAESADHGPRGRCESGHGISQRRAGRDDRRQHRVQAVGRDGALDPQPLGARSYPPDPVAHRVGGYAQVGADCAVALATGAGQQRLSDDVDGVGAMRGCQCG